MSEYKYPYISDKRLYGATMYACKMIRESGFFNKAIDEATEKYNVDKEKLKKCVAERQAVGRKGKKYKWYIVERYTDIESENCPCFKHETDLRNLRVVRALNRENASKVFDMNWDSCSYSAYCQKLYCDKEFKTKKDAETYLKELSRVR